MHCGATRNNLITILGYVFKRKLLFRVMLKIIKGFQAP
jgi:hypothetical protein